MANKEHLNILEQGIDVWNAWRGKNLHIQANLSRAVLCRGNLKGAILNGADLNYVDMTEADLSGAKINRATITRAFLIRANLSKAYLKTADLAQANLSEANLTEANLTGANLSGAKLLKARLNRAILSTSRLSADFSEADLSEARLVRANLSGANLKSANLKGADLNTANLTGANLSEADLTGANLSRANLSGANLMGTNLSGADLTRAQMIEVNLEKAKLNDSRIYGISAWNLKVDNETVQKGLIITRADESAITTDNLEVAQFLYLLLHNERIRHVIDTITSKVVLILGRFTPERKMVLDAIREELRSRDYLPVMFDFDKPAGRDTHETITTLARLARFVIADITDPKSIPQELVSIVEQLPSLPVQPILLQGHEPWGMFDHIQRYPWVLEVCHYKMADDLLSRLYESVIAPAEAEARKIRSDLAKA